MNFDDHDGDGQIQEISDLPGGVSGYVRRHPPSNSTTYPSPLPVAKLEPSPPPTTAVSSLRKSNSSRYRECLKNHAVGIGGHALDGCGEFMPAGEEGTIDALKCAACNCHRNFHRKEVLDGIGVGFGLLGISDTTTASTPSSAFHQTHFAPYYRTPTGYLYPNIPNQIAPPPLALPSTSGGGREDPEDMTGGSGGGSWRSTTTKKRSRTKFTAEQKDKMLDLAERLGWRMQKQDEALVQQFCTDTGVRRQVLKVWMHNNKQTLGKSPTTSSTLIQQTPPAQVINNNLQ